MEDIKQRIYQSDNSQVSSEAGTMPRLDSTKTKKQFMQNVGSGWLAIAVSAVVGVFILPINLHFLGKEVYGISVLATSILNILQFLNFGLTPTLLRFFSKAIAENDREQIHRLSSTAQLLTNSLGVLGAVILMCCFPWFCSTYEITADQRFSTLFLFVGLAFSFWEGFYLINYGAILQSYQRLDFLNLVRIISVVLRVIGLYVFYKFFWASLVSMGVVLILDTTFRLVVIVIATRRLCGSSCGFSWRHVDLSWKADGLLVAILSFGALAFINNIGMGLSIQVPALIIGKELGKRAVADFSAALTIAGFLSSILAAIVVPLTPLASLDAKEGGKRLRSWAISIGQIVSCAGCAAILVLCLFGRGWLTVWLGESFAWTLPIVVVMASGIVLASVQGTNYNLALGANSIAPIAWSALVMAILVTSGTYLWLHYQDEFQPLLKSLGLIPRFSPNFIGLLGVACIVGGVRFIRNVVYIAYDYSKRFDYNYWEYLFVVYAQPLLAVVVIVILWKYTFGLLDFTPLQDFFEKLVPHERLKGRIALALVLALKSGIACFLYCIYCWFFVMPKQLKESLVGIFRRKLLRKG